MGSRSLDRQPLARGRTDDEESHSVVVCELLRRTNDASIRELPPLADAIDPDALDAVFGAADAQGTLAFEYAGRDVLVRSNGAVEVYPADSVTD